MAGLKKSASKKSGKIFVLDTNVLLHDPQAIFKFQENDIIIPLVVIEEMDDQKRRQDEVGRNARRVAKLFDQMRQQGKLHEGIPTEGGGTIRVELSDDIQGLPEELLYGKSDNRILGVAQHYKQKHSDRLVILVTKDTYLRVKADALGILAEDYKTDKVNIDELYTGAASFSVSVPKINEFFHNGHLVWTESELVANQFVTLIADDGGNQSALGRYDAAQKAIVPLRFGNKDAWGIKARNKEQRFAMELLMDDNIKLVTLVGQAGTGKTLLAVAAGLQKVLDENTYKKLLVTRPVVPLGNDIGFLPGDKDEKLRPWMSPIYDNIEYILNGAKEGKKEKDDFKPTNIENTIRYFKDRGQLELEAITYIRGRSIPHQYIIVDEAQNLTPHEVKTMLTRAGEGTKIVLTGDPHQVDHPYLDSNSNGLTYVAEKFKDQGIAGHIIFTKGERSELAELAASLI
ncbi:MAG: PhoH family protein [Clostridia bacterium]|nr:PhoH family protein [Clostridia bacterium]